MNPVCTLSSRRYRPLPHTGIELVALSLFHLARAEEEGGRKEVRGRAWTEEEEAAAEEKEYAHMVPSTSGSATRGSDHGDVSSASHENTLWLDAWHDPVAGLKVASAQCVLLADLGAKQDSNLIVADASRRLKVWQGLNICADLKLLDSPTAICSFYPDSATPRVPSVAVAAGAFIYIYRNLKPYYKFTMPIREVHVREETAWRRFIKDEMDGDTLVHELSKLRDEGVRVSYTTTDLLTVRDRAQRTEMLAKLKTVPRPFQMHSVATCLTSINKTVEGDEYAQSVLLVGCEGGSVLIMDSSGTAIQRTIDVPSTPVMMSVSGVLEVEYRVTFSGRNGKMYARSHTSLLMRTYMCKACTCTWCWIPVLRGILLLSWLWPYLVLHSDAHMIMAINTYEYDLTCMHASFVQIFNQEWRAGQDGHRAGVASLRSCAPSAFALRRLYEQRCQLVPTKWQEEFLHLPAVAYRRHGGAAQVQQQTQRGNHRATKWRDPTVQWENAHRYLQTECASERAPIRSIRTRGCGARCDKRPWGSAHQNTSKESLARCRWSIAVIVVAGAGRSAEGSSKDEVVCRADTARAGAGDRYAHRISAGPV